MNIVQIEDFFHPDAGYQPNILAKMMVAKGHRVTIMCGEIEKMPDELTAFFGKKDIEQRDRAYSEKYGVKIVRVPVKWYYSGRACLSGAFFDKIEQEKPDVVFLHGNDTLTGMRYLARLKRLKYPLVMDNHMLEMATRNPLSGLFHTGYRMLFTPVLRKNNIQIIRTQNSDYVQKAYGIPLTQAPWISVGSDTMLFRRDDARKVKLRKELGIDEDSFVVLYAGKLSESKGGKLLAEAARKKLEADKKVVFVIVGNTENNDYGKSVDNTFKESENTVLRFGTQSYESLADFYHISDAVVFPKQCSLSFYDAQSCGKPVVFEDNEINIQRARTGSAVVFKSGDADDLRKKLKAVISMPNEDYEQMRRRAVENIEKNYDYKIICDRYLEVLEAAVKQYKQRLKG